MTKNELKDIIKECIEEIREDNEVELTKEQINLLNEFVEEYSLYENLYENYDCADDLDINILSEGSNIEIIKIFKQYKAQYKVYIKEIKQCIKSGDNNTAKSKINECKSILDKMEKEIKSIDSSIGSNICGFILSIIMTMVACIPLIITQILINKDKQRWINKKDEADNRKIKIHDKDLVKKIALSKVGDNITISKDQYKDIVTQHNDKKLDIWEADTMLKGLKHISKIPKIGIVATITASIVTSLSGVRKRIKEDNMDKKNAWNLVRNEVIDSINNMKKALIGLEKQL